MSITKSGLLGAAVAGALLLAACSSGSTTGSSETTEAAAASTAAAESSASASMEASAPAASEGPVNGTADQLLPDISSLCGTEPMVVGYADGFGGNSWRKIVRAEFEDEASKCPNITKVLYTDAQADPQKAISDINGLVAQGVNALVVFADSGAATLPAIKAATEAGVKVVPFIVQPGGTVGTDYTGFVAEDVKAYGEDLANWTIKTMGGKGNLVMLGGGPGNSYSQAVYDAVKAAAAENPDIKLLNTDGFVVTNWEPGETQKVVAGLLAKYGEIDGIVSDYGGGSVGGIRAFQAAGKPLPVWSANDSNEFACLWYDNKDANPNYQIATISSRTWMIRVALRRAVAAAQGLPDPEPQFIALPLSEDSTEADAPAPVCNKDLPPDAILSSKLSPDQLKTLFAS